LLGIMADPLGMVVDLDKPLVSPRRLFPAPLRLEHTMHFLDRSRRPFTVYPSFCYSFHRQYHVFCLIDHP
jgi:hypothetical protein